MMGILSVGNEQRKKRLLLLQELERYGVRFEGDEALKAPEYTLERLLREAKSRQDSSTTRSQDLFMDLYESMVCDYLYKLTVATVFFFYCYPWAALFWPPYYYHINKRSNQ